MLQNSKCPTCQTSGYIKGLHCTACAGFEELTALPVDAMPAPTAPTAPEQIPQFLDVGTLAKYLNVSVRTAWKWDHTRRLPGRVKMGKCVRWSRHAIDLRLLGGELLLPISRRK